VYTVLCASNSRDFKHGSIRVVIFSETIFNFLLRFSMITLGKSKENCNWHVLESRYQKF